MLRKVKFSRLIDGIIKIVLKVRVTMCIL